MNYETKFVHGAEVLVYDRKGEYEGRGTVRGINRTSPPFYDILPRHTKSLRDIPDSFRQVPEARLRAVSAPYLAYERKQEAEPKHILDEA